MFYKSAVLAFIPLFFATANAAEAGTIANNNWSPSNCGSAPVAEELDLKSPDAFNLSVEKVNTYRKKIPVFLDCIIGEANNDIQTITQTAKNLQQATKDAAKLAEDKTQADIKAADKKFGK